jgi:hypothetical protein
MQRTGVDEVIVASAMYDHDARLRSYEMLAELFIGSGEVAASGERKRGG